MSDSIIKMLQQQNENYENAIQDAREQLAKQAEQIKELRTTVSDQTEVINTERIINREQAEQLKEAEEVIDDIVQEALSVDHSFSSADVVIDVLGTRAREYQAKYRGKE